VASVSCARQHVEVGLRHAHDQVLLGGLEVGLGRLQRALAACSMRRRWPVEQRQAAAEFHGLPRVGCRRCRQHGHLELRRRASTLADSAADGRFSALACAARYSAA
jgi:hypothetical protein